MRVKFKYGIKSFSGTLDELTYANYESVNIVIGRKKLVSGDSEHKRDFGEIAIEISKLYRELSTGFMDDLRAYAKKMYRLKAFSDKIPGNAYSVFHKMMRSAIKDPESPIDVGNIYTGNILPGQYSRVNTIKEAVENGHLPVVPGYEEYIHVIS